MGHKWHILGLSLVLGATAISAAFVAGMYFQHEHASRRLQDLIQKDPYAYYVSPQIYEVVRVSLGY